MTIKKAKPTAARTPTTTPERTKLAVKKQSLKDLDTARAARGVKGGAGYSYGISTVK